MARRIVTARQQVSLLSPWRQAALLKTAADLAKEYTQQLYDEFHDWAKDAKWLEGGNAPADYARPMGGPLTYWGNIEKFFKDRYPEAHRGFNMAEEKARPLMDNGRATWSSETLKAPPYETGPEAIDKYGYDPKALAAGMMYLHTWSHAQSPQNSWRGDKLPRDINRLTDIFQKRQQMQDVYKQRQPTASRRRTAMPSRTVPVGTQGGLHTRPSSIITDAVLNANMTGNPGQVTLAMEGQPPVDASKFMDVMSLGALRGTPITVSSDNEALMHQVADIVAHDHDTDKSYYNRFPPMAFDQMYDDDEF